MTFILYFFGFLIGLAFFLYMLSAYHSGKDSIKKIAEKRSGNGSGKRESSTLEPDKISYKHLKQIPPGERMCPLCRTSLSSFEPLYASQVETGTGRRILIHGCGYCYKNGDAQQ